MTSTSETMNKERKLIIAGNWKMNKTVAEALDLVRGLKIELANVKEVDIVVCPPFTALSEVSKAILDSNLRLGAQNMSENNVGAFTGEIAAVMLKEFSVRYVILDIPNGANIRKSPTRSLRAKPWRFMRHHSSRSSAWVKRWLNAKRNRQRRCWTRKSGAAWRG